MSSASSAAERTFCPHCGLTSETASDGVCVECWQPKSRRSVYAPGKRPVPTPRAQHGGSLPGRSLLDEILDGLLDDIFPWWP